MRVQEDLKKKKNKQNRWESFSKLGVNVDLSDLSWSLYFFFFFFSDRPKVRLPRFLRQRYVAQVGDKINLTIPFTVSARTHVSQCALCMKHQNSLNFFSFFFPPQGKPKPVVSWTKNGQALDAKRVNIRSTDRDSILFIRAAEREDSGVYEMCVKVDDFEDKAPLTLQIVG